MKKKPNNEPLSKLRWYTTTIEVGRTLSDIDKVLAKIDVVSVYRQYKNGCVSGVEFVMPDENGNQFAVRLPIDVESVYAVMLSETKSKRVRSLTSKKIEQIKKQAERTAWRLQYEWLAIQASFIAMKQVKPTEAFMPQIIMNNGVTVFKSMENRINNLMIEGAKINNEQQVI